MCVLHTPVCADGSTPQHAHTSVKPLSDLSLDRILLIAKWTQYIFMWLIYKLPACGGARSHLPLNACQNTQWIIFARYSPLQWPIRSSIQTITNLSKTWSSSNILFFLLLLRAQVPYGGFRIFLIDWRVMCSYGSSKVFFLCFILNCIDYWTQSCKKGWCFSVLLRSFFLQISDQIIHLIVTGCHYDIKPKCF